ICVPPLRRGVRWWRLDFADAGMGRSHRGQSWGWCAAASAAAASMAALTLRADGRRMEPLQRQQSVAILFGQAFAFALELTAGGKDVAAAPGAHRRGVAGLVDDIGKALDAARGRVAIVRARPGIERVEVDRRRNDGVRLE